MASVNQTRPHCVNQVGKTCSKPLAARHGRGTAWTRHFMCESTLRVLLGGSRGGGQSYSGQLGRVVVHLALELDSLLYTYIDMYTQFLFARSPASAGA